MTIKLFTHNADLDGMGCAWLFRTYYSKDYVDISYVDYNNVNDEVIKFLNNDTTAYSKIFITDISISEEVAKLIEYKYKDKVVLIDHHISEGTKHLEKYDWVILKGKKDINDNELCSATWLVKEWISKHSNEAIDTDSFVNDIVTSIDRYDTWLWKTKYKEYKSSKDLNNLFHLVGKDNLLEDIEYSYEHYSFYEPSYVFKFMLQLNENKYKTVLDNCNKFMQRLIYKDYTIGLVYANEFISELGNDLARMNDDVDFVALANLTTGFISFRGIKDNIHLGNIAKELGESLGTSGGGHPLASSVDIKKLKNDIIMPYIFKDSKFI